VQAVHGPPLSWGATSVVGTGPPGELGRVAVGNSICRDAAREKVKPLFEIIFFENNLLARVFAGSIGGVRSRAVLNESGARAMTGHEAWATPRHAETP